MLWDIVSKTKTISSVELVYSSFHFSFCFVLYTIGNWRCYSKVVFYMCFIYFEVKVWYIMSWCKKNSCFYLMLTLFRCPLITENKHLLRDPELSSVTRNCQIYIMSLDTLKIGIYKLKDSMNCIKVKRNNLLNSIYSSVSPDFVLKRHPTLISLLTRNCRVHCMLIIWFLTFWEITKIITVMKKKAHIFWKTLQ